MGASVLSKPNITVDQMVKSSEAAKKFGEMRKRAKEAPLYITENGTIDTVLISYSDYEYMYELISEFEKVMESNVLSERVEGLEKNPDIAVSWRAIRRDK